MKDDDIYNKLWNTLTTRCPKVIWGKIIRHSIVILLQKETSCGLKYLYYSIYGHDLLLLPPPSLTGFFSFSGCLMGDFLYNISSSVLEQQQKQPQGFNVDSVKSPKGISIYSLFDTNEFPGGGYVTTIQIPENLHGQLMTGEFETTQFDPVQERFILYCAEKHSNSNSVVTDHSNNHLLEFNKFNYKHTWGETHEGQSTGRLFIADRVSGKVIQIQWDNDKESLGQAIWLPDSTGFIVTVWDTSFPYRLGTALCQNRMTWCYICVFKEPLNVSLTNNQSTDVNVVSLIIKTPIVLRNENESFTQWDSKGFAMHTPCILSSKMDNSWRLTVCVIPEQKRNMHWSAVQLAVSEPFTMDSLSIDQYNMTLSCKENAAGGIAMPLDPNQVSLLGLSSDLIIFVSLTKEWRHSIFVYSIFSNICKQVDIQGIHNRDSMSISMLSSDRLLDCNDTTLLIMRSSPDVPLSIIQIHLQFDINDKCCLHIRKQESIIHLSVQHLLQDLPCLLSLNVPNELRCKWEDLSSQKSAFSIQTTGHKGVILYIHGGPNSAIVPEFSLPLLYLVLLGYTILCVNYRGSLTPSLSESDTSCGYISTNDVQDCLESVQDFVHKHHPDITVPMMIIGGSHGGFIALHLLGKYPNTFCAASVRNPVCNLPVNLAASDIPDWTLCQAFNSTDILNTGCIHPITDKNLIELYSMSPIRYVNQVTTPVLIALGQNDQRVPPCQGLEYYNQLLASQRVRDITTSSLCSSIPQSTRHQLLWYPHTGHAINHPECQANYWIYTAKWFQHWSQSQ